MYNDQQPDSIVEKAAERRSIKTSLLIGVPIGILILLSVFILPLIQEGKNLGDYRNSIIGEFVSFIFALWFSGKRVCSDIFTNKKILLCSFKYSLTVNLFIWSTTMLIGIINRGGRIINRYGAFDWYLIIPPFFAFIICTILTTFTLGLLICYVIKRQITEAKS